MAKKNDFSDISTSRITESIEKATGKRRQQGTASKEEQEERKAALRTQGRKGCKSIRINVAITPENHEFIKIMAQATGRNLTQMTNAILTAYRKDHPEFLEKAADFLQVIKNEQWDV